MSTAVPWGADVPRLRPVVAEVDVTALSDNAARLLANAEGADLLAVVKADGYGHGAVTAARAALRGGATWLGVAMVEEGTVLREAGIDAPILLLSEPPIEAVDVLLDARLTPTVYSHGFTTALATRGETPGRGGPVGVHLKLDTGMHRVGLPEPGWDEVFARLATSDGVRVEGIWSHLAVGDEAANPYTSRQHAALLDGLRRAAAAGLRPRWVHLANSGGQTLFPETHRLGVDVWPDDPPRTLVRGGIALYGLEAAPGVRLDGLRPALALRSALSFVKPLAAGERVSYGLRWTAPRDTVVGTVPGGYADGIRRGLNRGEDRAWAVVGGRRVEIVGTICMDQLLVDLGPGAADRPGDPVWFIGGPGPEVVTAADWAGWLDTITYEVTCGLTGRVPREVVGDERIVEVAPDD